MFWLFYPPTFSPGLGPSVVELLKTATTELSRALEQILLKKLFRKSMRTRNNETKFYECKITTNTETHRFSGRQVNNTRLLINFTLIAIN